MGREEASIGDGGFKAEPCKSSSKPVQDLQLLMVSKHHTVGCNSTIERERSTPCFCTQSRTVGFENERDFIHPTDCFLLRVDLGTVHQDEIAHPKVETTIYQIVWGEKNKIRHNLLSDQIKIWGVGLTSHKKTNMELWDWLHLKFCWTVGGTSIKNAHKFWEGSVVPKRIPIL